MDSNSHGREEKAGEEQGAWSDALLCLGLCCVVCLTFFYPAAIQSFFAPAEREDWGTVQSARYFGGIRYTTQFTTVSSAGIHGLRDHWSRGHVGLRFAIKDTAQYIFHCVSDPLIAEVSLLRFIRFLERSAVTPDTLELELNALDRIACLPEGGKVLAQWTAWWQHRHAAVTLKTLGISLSHRKRHRRIPNRPCLISPRNTNETN